MTDSWVEVVSIWKGALLGFKKSQKIGEKASKLVWLHYAN
jgi:hypothetical protein